MKFIASLVLSSVLLVGASFASGCAVDAQSDARSIGQVRMALTGTSVEGNLYRLRAATFSIAGPVTAELETESDPDLTVLSADLPAGSYQSTLGGDWYLERLSANGTFEPVDAALVSANPADFTVNAQVASDLVYQFATDGTIITIGDGTVNISIEVAEVTSLGSCTMFEAGCGAGQTCTVVSLDTLEGVCVAAGTGLSGSPCEGPSDCAPKHSCIGTTEGNVCLEMCDLETAICSSGFCDAAFGEGLYGACF